jgi:hypothetical protein
MPAIRRRRAAGMFRVSFILYLSSIFGDEPSVDDSFFRINVDDLLPD